MSESVMLSQFAPLNAEAEAQHQQIHFMSTIFQHGVLQGDF